MKEFEHYLDKILLVNLILIIFGLELFLSPAQKATQGVLSSMEGTNVLMFIALLVCLPIFGAFGAKRENSSLKPWLDDYRLLLLLEVIGIVGYSVFSIFEFGNLQNAFYAVAALSAPSVILCQLWSEKLTRKYKDELI